ncbi:hypothetical protein DOJK_00471 [Patescibacteria group bacterium]|nr:hypothetical protein DOJK_00471 [Patescibacteria group bacterium]
MMKKLIWLLLLLSLIACEQTQQTTTPISHQASKKYTQTMNLSGIVSNAQGRVKAGLVKVTNENQQIISTAEVNTHGQYEVSIPVNTDLPILLNFEYESEHLLVVAIDPAISKYDINPLTTKIAQKAKEMGGYTRANLVIAAENTVHVPDANKTTTGFRGDPTTQYGGWH